MHEMQRALCCLNGELTSKCPLTMLDTRKYFRAKNILQSNEVELLIKIHLETLFLQLLVFTQRYKEVEDII